MLRPLGIILDRFINRCRSKEPFFPVFHIFPAFLQNRLSASEATTRILSLGATGLVTWFMGGV